MNTKKLYCVKKRYYDKAVANESLGYPLIEWAEMNQIHLQMQPIQNRNFEVIT